MHDDNSHVIHKGFKFEQFCIHHVVAFEGLEAQRSDFVSEVSELTISKSKLVSKNDLAMVRGGFLPAGIEEFREVSMNTVKQSRDFLLVDDLGSSLVA